MPFIPQIKVGNTTYDVKDDCALRSANKTITNNNKSTNLPTGDLNDLIDRPLVYYFSGLSGISNSPIDTMTGVFVVMKYSYASNIGITQIFYADSGDIYYRNNHGNTSNPIWENWNYFSKIEQTTVITENNYTDIIPDGDLDNLYDNRGTYYLARLTSPAHLCQEKMDGILIVSKYNSGTSIGVLQTYFGNEGEIAFRIRHGSVANASWEGWTRLNSRLNSLTCKIFKKVVCCGDSYTSGYIVDNNDTVFRINEMYAWPHYMETLTGNTWVNCGHSGTTALTWQTATRGLPKAIQSGKTQAYIVALMINDASTGTNHLDVGTANDIGTNASTYYAQYSKIIRTLAGISPQAFIFICTIPRNEEDYDHRYDDYNQAIYDIYEAYKNTYKLHILDLYKNRHLYESYSLSGDKKSGHFTAIGYEQFAEVMATVLTDYINHNISTFQEVAFIPYDDEPSREGVEAIIQTVGSPTALNFSNSYIDATGKYVTSGGKKYFSIMITYKANVSSSVGSILSELPAPQNTGVLFYERNLGMQKTNGTGYLSYDTAWRINGPHSTGNVIFVFGVYE